MPAQAEEAFNIIRPELNAEIFDIENISSRTSYFPNYLSERLSTWLNVYKAKLQPLVDDVVPYENGAANVTLNRTQTLIDNITKTVALYYEGKVFEATSLFNDAMDQLFKGIQKSMSILPSSTFYRARIGNESQQFEKKHLFHIPFELRHIVSTNRYSIPGFPALYLGDSTYVCWEEGNRSKLKAVNFSRFENIRELKVIEISLYKDFYEEVIQEPHPEYQLRDLLRYIATFPLILACTIKVKEQLGSFKPEYIIPQLLLQYVIRQPDIDGIKFPSSKVDYKKLSKVKAYNYVFPVKTNKNEGFCEALMKIFKLTTPTSLEIEEVIDNPRYHTGIWLGGSTDNRYLELQGEVKCYYVNTSFGKLESILLGRKTDFLMI